MKFAISTSILGLGILLASCRPYAETPPPPPMPPADLAENSGNPGDTDGAEGTGGDAAGSAAADGSDNKPEREKIPDRIEDPDPPKPAGGGVEVARPVPGKPGFVFSPFNNKIIDVKGIPSGTLVADPTYPASEKKYFRVP